jgi:hypothetical protein
MSLMLSVTFELLLKYRSDTLIKLQMSLMLSFMFALFIEISSPISLPILRGVCKVGFSALTQVKATFGIQWNFHCFDKSMFLPKLPKVVIGLIHIGDYFQKSWSDPNAVVLLEPMCSFVDSNGYRWSGFRFSG